MKRRFLTAVLTACLLFSVCFISSSVQASSYTVNSVSFPLADYPDGAVCGNCFTLASAAYRAAWGTAFSQKDSNNMLRGKTYEITAANAKAILSQAPCGSMIHFSGYWYHYQFLLDKDENGVTIYEGNVNGGHVRIRYSTWDQYAYYWEGSSFDFVGYPDAAEYNPSGTGGVSGENTEEGSGESISIPTGYSCSFNDVTSDDWFYNAVSYVVNDGCFNGIGNGNFGPYNAMTREQFVTVLFRLGGEYAVSAGSPFADVTDSNSYYYKAVAWGAYHNIVSGIGNGNFGVGNTLTRQEMVTLLYRYRLFLGRSCPADGDLSQFSDGSEVDSWAREAMSWAVGSGVIQGMSDGTLCPKKPTTRAQVATVIARLIA